MNHKDTSPSVNVPAQGSQEPLGDRGQGDKTWTPERGEHGISNRPDDEMAAAADDDDDEFDEDEDAEDEDEDGDEVDEDAEEKS